MVKPWRSIWLGVLAVMLAAGCGGRSARHTAFDSPALLACPPGGIGAAELPDFDARAQLRDYDRFDCTQPQICPDQVFWRRGHFGEKLEVGSRHQVFFTLTNCSVGVQTLQIEKVTIRGDQHCAFGEPRLDRRELAPGETALLQLEFVTPQRPAEHHAQIEVVSNAANFSTLQLRACAELSDPSEHKHMNPPSLFRCEARDRIEPCHAEQR